MNTVSCEIFHTTLTDAPPYKALSYTWGDLSDRKHKIQLNGKPFEVRENLWTAINQLADVGEKVTIWIDAICIDQENVAERNHQVGIMRTIYGGAAQVYCWLGPADENSKLAFRLAKFVQEHQDSIDKIIDRFTHPDDDLLPSLDGVAALCQRDYWYRIWVVQEITLADTVTVCCGDDSIEWDAFFGLLRLIAGRYTDIGLLIDQLRDPEWAAYFRRHLGSAQILHTWRKDFKVSRPQLYQCLLHHSYRGSTDPRDLIFGLTGLDSGEHQMEINYSLPVAQIYTDFAKQEITTSGRLDILTQIRYLAFDGSKISKYNLPSWVPDWSLDLDCLFFREIYNKHVDPEFTASKGKPSECFFINKGSVLIFKGVQIDSIESSGSYTGIKDWDEYPRAVLAIQAWWNLIREKSSNDKISTSSQKAFVRLLLVDRSCKSKEGFYLSLLGHIAELSRKYHPHRAVDCTLSEYSDRVVPVLEDLGWLFDVFSMICVNILNRRFCVGAAGTLCLVPEVAREGDIICLPLGCSHPIVLRSIEDHYIVLGEAYADGWMYGKAIDELEKGKMQLRDFEIR
jgi:hypothetical protein